MFQDYLTKKQLFLSGHQVQGSAECPLVLTFIRVGLTLFTPLKLLFLAHFQIIGALMSATPDAPNLQQSSVFPSLYICP